MEEESGQSGAEAIQRKKHKNEDLILEAKNIRKRLGSLLGKMRVLCI